MFSARADRVPADAVREGSRVPWGALAALTVLGLALRLYRLDSGLWLDEIHALLDIFRQPTGWLITTFVRDIQHPLYSIFAHASLSILGESAWTLRLPAALFGAATIPALYFLGRETVGSREGLLAAALLTVSYHHVWFSQNARGYTLLAFFVVAATYCLVRAIREENSRLIVAYALLVGLGAYTHLTMVFLAVGQAGVVLTLLVWPAAERRGRWSQALWAFGGAAVVTLALYAPMLGQVVDYFANRPSSLQGVSTPGWALAEAVRVLRLGFGRTLGLLLVALYLGGGFWRLLRRSPLVLGLFAVPVLVTVAGAALARGTMYPRFFFFLAGFGVLILVEGAFWVGSILARLTPSAWPSRDLSTALVGAIVVASALSLPLNYRYPKQDYAGAIAFVDSSVGPDDTIVTPGVADRLYGDYYELSWPRVESVESVGRLRGGGAVWLVYSFPRYIESAKPDLWNLVERDCAREVRFRGTVGGGDIIVCRFPPSRESLAP